VPSRVTRADFERVAVVGAQGWDRRIGYVADIPWGVIAFFAILILVLAGALEPQDVTGLGTATGLLGVGHGLHLGAKHLASRRDAPHDPEASAPTSDR
jgi:hypothetical protein